jgi:Lipocalin / cytosolic fatty-acid binding protein family.
MTADKLKGKFTFSHDDNYEAYLTAANFGMIQRKAMASTKPEIIIDVMEDGSITIEEVTTLKTAKMSFRLGEEYQHDPGNGKNVTYLAVMEGDDTLVTKEVWDASSSTTYKVTGDGLVITMTKQGVTGTRTFSKN